MIQLEQVLSFLNKKGWQQADSSEHNYFFKPPVKLGLDEAFSLAIPKLTTSASFSAILSNIVDRIADIYKSTPDDLFADISSYFQLLKKDAIYFSLASTEIVFGTTLRLESIGQFVKNLNESYCNYIDVDFRNTFGESFNNDEKKIASTLKRLKDYNKLRVVSLVFQNSYFGIGVASDIMMGNDKIGNDKIKKWRKRILPEFKKKILGMDFHTEKALEKVKKRFTEDERKAIFEPLVRNIHDNHYSISLTNALFIPELNYRKIPQTTLSEIFPEKKVVEVKSEMQLMRVILPVDKSKSKITISRAQLENDLFTQTTQEFSWSESKINYEGRTIFLEKPITYDVKPSIETGNFIVNFMPLEMQFEVEDFSKIRSEFYRKFITLYDLLQGLPHPPKGKEIKLLAFFDSVLATPLRS